MIVLMMHRSSGLDLISAGLYGTSLKGLVILLVLINSYGYIRYTYTVLLWFLVGSTDTHRIVSS